MDTLLQSAPDRSALLQMRLDPKDETTRFEDSAVGPTGGSNVVVDDSGIFWIFSKMMQRADLYQGQNCKDFIAIF